MLTSSIIYAAVSVATGGLLIALATLAVVLRRRKASQVEVALLDSIASVETPLEPEGAVLVRGELWRARSRSGANIARGHNNVRIVGTSAHLLEVEEEWAVDRRQKDVKTNNGS